MTPSHESFFVCVCERLELSQEGIDDMKSAVPANKRHLAIRKLIVARQKKNRNRDAPNDDVELIRD